MKLTNNFTVQQLLAEYMVEYGGTSALEKAIADGTIEKRITDVATSNDVPVHVVCNMAKRQIASFECNARKRGFGNNQTANKDKAVAMYKAFIEGMMSSDAKAPRVRSIIQEKFGKASHQLNEAEIREAMADDVMSKKLYDSFADYSSKHGYEVSDDFFERHELVKELYRNRNAAKRAQQAAQARATEVTTEQSIDVLRKKLSDGKSLSKADKDLLSALLSAYLG